MARSSGGNRKRPFGGGEEVDAPQHVPAHRAAAQHSVQPEPSGRGQAMLSPIGSSTFRPPPPPQLQAWAVRTRAQPSVPLFQALWACCGDSLTHLLPSATPSAGPSAASLPPPPSSHAIWAPLKPPETAAGVLGPRDALGSRTWQEKYAPQFKLELLQLAGSPGGGLGLLRLLCGYLGDLLCPLHRRRPAADAGSGGPATAGAERGRAQKPPPAATSSTAGIVAGSVAGRDTAAAVAAAAKPRMAAEEADLAAALRVVGAVLLSDGGCRAAALASCGAGGADGRSGEGKAVGDGRQEEPAPPAVAPVLFGPQHSLWPALR